MGDVPTDVIDTPYPPQARSQCACGAKVGSIRFERRFKDYVTDAVACRTAHIEVSVQPCGHRFEAVDAKNRWGSFRWRLVRQTDDLPTGQAAG